MRNSPMKVVLGVVVAGVLLGATISIVGHASCKVPTWLVLTDRNGDDVVMKTDTMISFWKQPAEEHEHDGSKHGHAEGTRLVATRANATVVETVADVKNKLCIGE